jgi:hypothetical protein
MSDQSNPKEISQELAQEMLKELKSIAICCQNIIFRFNGKTRNDKEVGKAIAQNIANRAMDLINQANHTE